MTFVTSMALAATACLSAQNDETATEVMLGSDTGTTAGSTSGDSSTQPAIMTTTDEPDTTDDPGTASTSMTGTTTTPDTTTGVPANCGNGSLEPGEECDEGEANANEGTCTKSCKSAACGDGFVQPGVSEICDDGVNDNSYGGCAGDCKNLGPHCGDGVVADTIEACDGGDPWDVAGGCLPNCEHAQSCKQIRENFPDNDAVVDGVYLIERANKPPFPVYCDMDADGGGYTFLKVALPEDGAKINAAKAEIECAKYGMKLLVTRTPMHVVASALAAKSAMLEPVGGGTTKGNIDYLKILGIYPVTQGKSCVGKPLNSKDCPEWMASGGTYHVTATVIPGQPNTTNCDKCSMSYLWGANNTVEFYEAVYNDALGAETLRFMCDPGDKLGA